MSVTVGGRHCKISHLPLSLPPSYTQPPCPRNFEYQVAKHVKKVYGRSIYREVLLHNPLVCTLVVMVLFLEVELTRYQSFEAVNPCSKQNLTGKNNTVSTKGASYLVIDFFKDGRNT